MQDSITLRFDLEADGRYINLPIDDESPEVEMNVVIDEVTALAAIGINLAIDTPQYWVYIDTNFWDDFVEALKFNNLKEDHKGSNNFKGSYHSLRPFHG